MRRLLLLRKDCRARTGAKNTCEAIAISQEEVTFGKTYDGPDTGCDIEVTGLLLYHSYEVFAPLKSRRYL